MEGRKENPPTPSSTSSPPTTRSRFIHHIPKHSSNILDLQKHAQKSAIRSIHVQTFHMQTSSNHKTKKQRETRREGEKEEGRNSHQATSPSTNDPPQSCSTQSPRQPTSPTHSIQTTSAPKRTTILRRGRVRFPLLPSVEMLHQAGLSRRHHRLRQTYRPSPWSPTR